MRRHGIREAGHSRERDLSRRHLDTHGQRHGHTAEGRAFEALEPVGRFGTAQEIANMALFLASDDAGFCTGARSSLTAVRRA
jgi:NAD(P)-dependent dehydrogenase (short-subunit alcohol dehydrogenase family)